MPEFVFTMQELRKVVFPTWEETRQATEQREVAVARREAERSGDVAG